MKKISFILGLFVIFLVLFSLSGYAQSLSGCCCDFASGLSQKDSFQDYSECEVTFNFVLPNAMDQILNRTCSAICAVWANQTGGVDIPPPSTGTKCGDADYTPAPANLRANNIKGESKIRLIWDAECPVDYFEVSRCNGVNCNNFEILSDQITLAYFVDSSEDLLWDEDYTYRVVAHYNLQGDSDAATRVANTGDIECWNRADAIKFCLSSVYYEQFKSYFQLRGYKLTPPGNFYINFSGAVRDQFFEKFNKAFFCDGDNKLSSPDDVCARNQVENGICISDAGVVDCIEPSDCLTAETEGTFGLYSSAITCEGDVGERKFCYLDKSKSIIDSCYKCSQDMTCYSYRSEDACGSDNCGVGDCEWRDVYPDIGIGVCADARFSACNLCSREPQGGSSEAFNQIFEQCSEQKSNALATIEYPCYWKSWQSLSCDEVSCTTYKRKSECGSPPSGITLSADNSIQTKSIDSCGVGVCQWLANVGNPEQGECLKNADGDTGLWPDCNFADNKEACERDTVPPVTDMVPTGALGVYDQLNINIFDKISRNDPGEYKTGSKVLGYTTYMCHYPEGGAECNIHSNPLSTEVGVLSLNFLTLHNTEVIESQTKLTDLAVGYNIIKYYSVDASKNKGIVKDVRVFACSSCVGPKIIDYSFTNGVKIGTKHYTKSIRPEFRAAFNVPAEITTAEIDHNSGELASYMTFQSGSGMNFTFVSETGLEEGDYKIRINSKDSEGTFMNQEFALPFTVDLTAGMVNFTVNGQSTDGLVVDRPMADVGITFSEKITSINVYINGQNVTGAFTTSNGLLFTARNLPMQEGIVTITVEAKDLADNSIVDSTSFEVNARPPVIHLRYPTFGIASRNDPEAVLNSDFKFNIVVETLNRVNCRFLYDVPIPANFSYIDLEPFDTTDSNFHRINEFTEIKDGDFTTHTLHVFCLDSLRGMGNATFQISVDPDSPPYDPHPIIETAYADPVVIKEALAVDTYGTNLKIKTDELSFCKYSELTQNYSSMEGKFPGYIVSPHIPWPNTEEVPKTVHIKQVTVDEANKSYTYYVGCEDLAGWQSSVKIIDFSVDLTVPFGVEDFTVPPNYKNSTTVVLGVETNKRSFCFYGRTETGITNSFQNDGEYAHTTSLVNVPLGENTFYVQCFTKFQTPKETSVVLPITFVVDTTPPEMDYVNDSGPLLNDPDYSYFKNELRASWLGFDNESPVTNYRYMIETFYGKEAITNWTISLIGGQIVSTTGLNLSDDTTYRFRVQPQNGAGLIGEIMESNGITVDFDKMPASCNDSFFSGLPDETDMDCGGICPGCLEGKNCQSNIDCASGYCDNSTLTCKAPSCNDGLQNGGETGVDCGGSCANGCGLDSLCISNSDCETGNCANGLCVAPNPCMNGILDGAETGVDCGGSCPNACGSGSSCMGPADCSSGLCVSGVCEPKRREGEQCINDTECVSGLICKEGFCKVPKKEEGDSCRSSSECDDGLLCFEGSCALDSDGDGLPDAWELRYGLDPYSAGDAMLDSDGDKLSNLDEFSGGTDPSLRDTDGDGWYDGQELAWGTDPLDSSSRPSAIMGLFYHPLGYWWLWAIIILVLFAIGVGSFYGYNTYRQFKAAKEKKKQKEPAKKLVPSKEKEKIILTDAQRKLLQNQVIKDKEISGKLEKLRGLIEKKTGLPPKKITDQDWVNIDNLIVPLRKEYTEMSPLFEKLDKLKKGKLGARGREKALLELEKFLGKKVTLTKEEAEKKEQIIKKEEKSAFEKLQALGKSAKKKKDDEKKEMEKDPIARLKMMVLTQLSSAERKEIMEKLILLRTGKLSAAERKALFEKLRITAEYYEKNKHVLEKEISQYKKSKKLKTKATKK